MRRLLPGFAGLLLLATMARAEGVDLTGTWYVLVHYKDDVSGKPDAVRWEDRVWVFDRSGDKLEWKDYPIVVFQDDEGRFERSRRGYSRVVGAWEPDPGQLAQIKSGLEINERGSKKKTLVGSDAAGWKSVASEQPKAANYVTYSETWAVKDAASKPAFARNESLGSAGMESMEGGTLFKTDSVADAGAELRGSFERDGTRHGSFRMLRAGAVSNVGRDGKTPNEKQRERIEALIREQLKTEGELTPDAVNKALDAQEAQ
jgi:hypothetical protein